VFLFWRTHKAIEEIVSTLLSDSFKQVDQRLGVVGDVLKLREEVEQLKIEKGRREEEFARREREIEHKLGLERARQAFEVDESKRTTMLDLREENLKADRQRFEEQLKFHEDRFAEEVGYLKGMIGDIVKRLPTAEILDVRSQTRS